MADASSAPDANKERTSEPGLTAGYDSYRSLAYPSLLIFVPTCTNPPFHLKAGGWKLLKSSTELNSHARARIAEKGYLIELALNPDEQALDEQVLDEQVPDEQVPDEQLADEQVLHEPVLDEHTEPTKPLPTVELTLEAAAEIPEKGRSVEAVGPSSSGEQVLTVQLEHDTPSLEIEFALVLSRMIDSVKSDPEHLRGTVYELARIKLKQQFGSETSADMLQLTKALETAIHSVETFVQRNDFDARALPRPSEAQQQRQLTPSYMQANARPPATVVDVGTARRTMRFTAPWRFAFVVGIGFAVVLGITGGAKIQSLKNKVGQIANFPTGENPKPTPVSHTPETKQEPAGREPIQPPPVTPTSYGIYAVSEDKLYELELLPIRAPDIRIAVSPIISAPSKTTLPSGHLKFIVYRRDSASNAVDHAEVRIIAKIARGTNFNPDGKALVSKIDDAWVIRNIAIPFRTAPKKDSPDMYEVQSENPDQALTPGRYALVLKGQTYDFAVAGEPTDPRQCLERLAAANGQFYSECRKP